MVVVSTYGQMAHYMKAIGFTIRCMGLDVRFIPMALFTKASGKIISTAARDALTCQTATTMKGHLKMDSFMVRACRIYELGVSTKANSRRDPSMDKAILYGKITAGIKERLSKIIWTAWGRISGPMAPSMKGIGVEEKCRDKVHSE